MNSLLQRMLRRLSGETHDRIALEVLAQARTTMYGSDIVGLSRGRISRGSVYIILSRLEDRGHVESVAESTEVVPGVRRLAYRITEQGREVLASLRAAPPARPAGESGGGTGGAEG